jgi:hypothetical protein
MIEYINKPHQQLVESLEETVAELSHKKESNILKIIASPTNVGKSFAQDGVLRDFVSKYHPDIKIILRLGPTKDVAGDGVFSSGRKSEDGSSSWVGFGFKTPKQFSTLIGAFDQLVINNEQKLCISMTHGMFLSPNNDIKNWLKKFQNNIFIVIEEIHQFFACPIPGAYNMSVVFGGGGGAYKATMPSSMREWMEKNPRVIGFSATPSVAQTKEYGDFEGKLYKVVDDLDHNYKFYFDVIDSFPEDVKDLIPHQAWVKKTFTYQLKRGEPESSVDLAISTSVKRLFETQNKLNIIKNTYDENITSKLVWFGICGNESRCKWGAPPSFSKDIITRELKKMKLPNEHYIGVMLESGCFTYDLEGNRLALIDDKQLTDKLNDPNDPVQFLLSINKGRSGINVHRISEIFVGRVRDIKLARHEVSVQSYGRGSRINTGTIHSAMNNDLRQYICWYNKTFNIPIEYIVETLILSNSFNITYPQGVEIKKSGYVRNPKDIWGGALEDFLEKYCNKAEMGELFLRDFMRSLGINLTNCPLCGSLLSGKFDHEHSKYEQIDINPLNSFFDV